MSASLCFRCNKEKNEHEINKICLDCLKSVDSKDWLIPWVEFFLFVNFFSFWIVLFCGNKTDDLVFSTAVKLDITHRKTRSYLHFLVDKKHPMLAFMYITSSRIFIISFALLAFGIYYLLSEKLESYRWSKRFLYKIRGETKKSI